MEKGSNISEEEKKLIQKRIKNLKAKIIRYNKRFNKEFNLENEILKNNIVFNKDLENIENMNIKYIILGDNPGMDEKNEGRYFWGKVGQEFREFLSNEFHINIKNEVVFLNKTLISTNITEELKGDKKELDKIKGELNNIKADMEPGIEPSKEIQNKINKLEENMIRFKDKTKFTCYNEIQKYMAQFTLFLHEIYPNAEVWVTGGINNRLFNSFFNRLSEIYSNNEVLFEKVYFFSHFSNKNFEYDFFKKYYNKTKEKSGIPCIEEVLRELGKKNKNEKIEKQKVLNK